MHQAFKKKVHAAFDHGRGFERVGCGGGGDLPSPRMAFFNIHVIDNRHIRDIQTFHTSGDTLPVAFYVHKKA